MKAAELKKKPVLELRKLLTEERAKFHQLNFDLAGGKVKNVRGIRESRRTIAQILTLLTKQ